MRIGYYIAKTNEFRGNCITRAGHAMLLWEHGPGAGFSDPSPFDGARVVVFDDGTVLKQLIVKDFFVENGEVMFHDIGRGEFVGSAY